MKFFRLALRLLLALPTCAVALLTGMILAIGGSLTGKGTTLVTCWWGKITCAVFNLTVSGDVQSRSSGARLIVGNHQSFFDIPVHSGYFCGRFVAKGDDLLHYVLFFSRCIWVKRNNFRSAFGLSKAIRRTLDRGIAVLVYPEGTTGDGKRLLSFKTTVFDLAIKNHLPVRPVVTLYETPDGTEVGWQKESFWHNFCRVAGYPKLRVRIFVLPEEYPQPGEGRREFATRVRILMQRQLDKLRAERS